MMKTNNKFLVRMDLSIMPKDIINCIGRHLIDFPVLEKEQLKKYDRKSIYLLYFFYNYNLPKDALKYNKFMECEKSYYKEHDFTQHNKQNLKPILKIIKNKYKDMHLKTYEISFDDAVYKRWKCNYSLYKFVIHDSNNKNRLSLSNEGITKITQLSLSNEGIAKITHKEHMTPYKDLKLSDKEVQLLKTTLKYIENDIKYYIQQCFTYSQIYFLFGK